MPSGILIHAAIWPKQIWAENGGLCPFGEGEHEERLRNDLFLSPSSSSPSFKLITREQYRVGRETLTQSIETNSGSQ